jgi:hypothetical protein
MFEEAIEPPRNDLTEGEGVLIATFVMITINPFI